MVNIRGKEGIQRDALAWLIIAAVVLVLMVTGYFFFGDTLSGIAYKLKNLFSFGG
ncbi:MAG: hypothetical protein Q7S56_01075 [Nanoarchaeota archaeon]|nr:hypothetical protein [Nanoarchaeota archaeon]